MKNPQLILDLMVKDCFPSRIRNKIGILLSRFLFRNVVEVLVRVIRQ